MPSRNAYLLNPPSTQPSTGQTFSHTTKQLVSIYFHRFPVTPVPTHRGRSLQLSGHVWSSGQTAIIISKAAVQTPACRSSCSLRNEHVQVGNRFGWHCQISCADDGYYIFTAGDRLSRRDTLVTPTQCTGKYITYTRSLAVCGKGKNTYR